MKDKIFPVENLISQRAHSKYYGKSKKKENLCKGKGITSMKKSKKSTESWRIYVRAKELSSLIILILMVHALIEANYT